jgi:hypothetical protein
LVLYIFDYSITMTQFKKKKNAVHPRKNRFEVRGLASRTICTAVTPSGQRGAADKALDFGPGGHGFGPLRVSC